MAMVYLEPHGKPRRQWLAVRDDNEDILLPPMEVHEQGRNDVGRLLIQVAGRLVAEQQPRLPDQCTRNRHALLLAS